LIASSDISSCGAEKGGMASPKLMFLPPLLLSTLAGVLRSSFLAGTDMNCRVLAGSSVSPALTKSNRFCHSESG